MITARNLHKSYGNTSVLRGVDLTIAKGESMVVIGGSGAGKSVLMKSLVGLVRPDSGTINIDGHATMPMDRFGMLFQGSALFDSLPVWENVAFRLLQNGMPRTQARDIAETKLARVGLSRDTALMLPAELSGGMQKRAGLARALAADPDIIFFDEPTTGLDPIMAGVINALIRDVVAETGATTLTITHDMTSVTAIADHVAMLHAGKIRWTGPVADLRSADDPYLAQFISGAAKGPMTAI